MTALTPSLRERKRILCDVCRKHKQWRLRIFATVLLFVVSIVIIIADVVLLVLNPTTTLGYIVFALTGICFACVPFFLAIGLKNSSKFMCGLPYSSYANGTVILYEDRLEYVFWRVGKDEPAAYSSKHAVYRDEDMFTYFIESRNISSLKVEDGICYINGPGRVIMPDWAVEDQTVKESFDEFSFAMAFEQNNSKQIIYEWRNKNV